MSTPSEHARPTHDLTPEFLDALKRMLEEAYREPLVEDWEHALGGVHFWIEENGEPVAHASVVERSLEIAGKQFRTGYLEAVATQRDRQRRGLGSRVVHAATEHVLEEYELGGLSTGLNALYARFGWETWRGPTFVRTDSGLERTADEDGGVMILRAGPSAGVDLDGAISCEWRAGDVW
jgi:aminoglycoside 2'-N-acetyltransferase I